MKRKKLILAPILAMLSLVIMLLVVLPTRAAGPLYVAPGGVDSGDCTNSASPCATIQYAVGMATAGDEIRVATGTYTSTGNEVVLLDKDATLSGGWDAGFTTQNGTSTIDGEGVRRGIYVNFGVTAIIERFTVQNGTGSDGGGIAVGEPGGGTQLTLNNSTVSSNTAQDNGGGIRYGGTLILNNSTVSGNAGNRGGGISNWPLGGSVTLNNSTVSGNTATGSAGGGIFNSGSVTLNNSTISSNTAQNDGGGIIYGGFLTLNNSTVSGNTTGDDGGGIKCDGLSGISMKNWQSS